MLYSIFDYDAFLYGSSFLYGNRDFLESQGLTYNEDMQDDWWVSVFVERFFPHYIAKTYPNFVQFVKYYLEFNEKYKNPLWVIGHLEGLYDIDRTLEDLFKKYIEQYVPDLNESGLDINVRFLIKNIKYFYQIKGTDNALKFLFRVIGHEPEIFYPVEYLLNCSDDQLLSDIYRLQDSYYWTYFTYDVSVNMPTSEWDKYIRTLAHPSGFQLFGTFNYEVMANGTLTDGDVNGNYKWTKDSYGEIYTFFMSNFSSIIRNTSYLSVDDIDKYMLNEVVIAMEDKLDLESDGVWVSDITYEPFDETTDGHITQIGSGATGIIRNVSYLQSNVHLHEVSSVSGSADITVSTNESFISDNYFGKKITLYRISTNSYYDTYYITSISGSTLTLNKNISVTDDFQLYFYNKTLLHVDIIDGNFESLKSIKRFIGHVSATNGLTAVTGVGTNFLTDLSTGDEIELDEIRYTINSILSNTLLYLSGSYQGETNDSISMITGFCALNNNSNSVVGIGTKFNTQLSDSSKIVIDEIIYGVDVIDDTHLNLKTYDTLSDKLYYGISGEKELSVIDPIVNNGVERGFISLNKTQGFFHSPNFIFDELVFNKDEDYTFANLNTPSYMIEQLPSGVDRHGTISNLLYITSIDLNEIYGNTFLRNFPYIKDGNIIGSGDDFTISGTLVHYIISGSYAILYISIDPTELSNWLNTPTLRSFGISGQLQDTTQVFRKNNIKNTIGVYLTQELNSIKAKQGIEIFNTVPSLENKFFIVNQLFNKPIWSPAQGLPNPYVSDSIIGYETYYIAELNSDDMIGYENTADYKLINYIEK